jgi:hypothetical protein
MKALKRIGWVGVALIAANEVRGLIVVSLFLIGWMK